MTVAIKKQVGWLKISMDYFSGMHKLESFYELVENVSIVCILQYFLSDGIMQISFHVLKDQVKVFFVVSLYDVVKFDYVRMRKLVQKYDFSICSLCVCRMLEGVKYFFEGEGLAWFLISDFPHMAVGSASYFFEKIIFL